MEELTVTEQLRAAVNPPLVPTERLVLRKPEALEAGLGRVGEALRPLQAWLVTALASRRGLEADLGSAAVTRVQAIIATGPERPGVVAATLTAAHGVGPVLEALVRPLAVVNVAKMEGKTRVGWLVAATGETDGGVAIRPQVTPWILALRPFVRAAAEADRSDYIRKVGEARSSLPVDQRAAWTHVFENEAWAAEDAAALAAGAHGLPAHRISPVARCLLPYLESEATFDAVAELTGSDLFTTAVYAEVLVRPPVARAVRRLTVLLAKPLEKESTAHVIQIAEVLACARSEAAAVAMASAAHLAKGPAKAYFAAHPEYLPHLEAAASGRGRNAGAVREIVVELERQRTTTAEIASEHLPRCIASPPWLTREAPWAARDLDVIALHERVVETEALRPFREQMARSSKASSPERDTEILGAKGAIDPARFFELSDDAALANLHRLAAYSLGCAVARFGAAAIPGLAALMNAKPLKTHADVLVHLRTPRLARVAWSFHHDEAWLLDDPESSALGLVPDLFAVQLHLRHAAEMATLRLCVAGHRDAVERAAERYGSDVARDVRAILDRDPAQRLPDPLPAIHAKFEDGSLPVLVTAHGPLPPSANATIGKLLTVSPAWLPHPGITELRAVCTVQSRDAFAWEAYRKTFGMKVLSLLGGDGCARNLDAELSSARSKLTPAQHHEAYQVLARIGTPLARALLAKHALLSPWRDRNERIDALLGASGRESHLEETLLALDVDPDRVTLDYGGRAFRVVVDEHLQPWVVDEGNKRAPKLPKPTKKDDAEKAAAAASAFDALRLDLDDHRQTALLWLERAMAQGHTWSIARLRRVVAHPLLGRLARRLVWEELGAKSRFFRVAEDGSFADDADAALTLADDSMATLAHPARLRDAVRDRFLQILHDYGIIQPFEQLQRESYLPSEDERAATELTRFDGRRVASARLEGLLGARGWQHGGHTTMHKPIGEYLAILEIPRRAVHARGATAADQLGKVTLRGPAGPTSFGSLSAVQASELFRDLETLPAA